MKTDFICFASGMRAGFDWTRFRNGWGRWGLYGTIDPCRFVGLGVSFEGEHQRTLSLLLVIAELRLWWKAID